MRSALIVSAFVAALAALIYLAGGGLDQFTLWAQTAQRGFQNQMALGLRALRAGEPGALLAFWGLCFAYGFVHAVGPGHGKFLLGAYGAGNQVPLGRMAGIGLISSLAQGASAIALVYAGVLIFDASREALQLAGDIWLERASLIAIALIGLWLMSRAVRKVLRQTLAAPVVMADHNHGHCDSCGHRHGPDMHEVSEAKSWRDMALLVGAIAIRPCTGALFVLILTWRMGLIWQGMVAVLVMALGTAAVTIAVGVTAVMAREGAMGWAQNLGRARIFGPALEALAGLFILFVALNMLKTL
jgi:ABC-type nickel/cobalt efflux system permease component RcnA